MTTYFEVEKQGSADPNLSAGCLGLPPTSGMIPHSFLHTRSLITMVRGMRGTAGIVSLGDMVSPSVIATTPIVNSNNSHLSESVVRSSSVPTPDKLELASQYNGALPSSVSRSASARPSSPITAFCTPEGKKTQSQSSSSRSHSKDNNSSSSNKNSNNSHLVPHALRPPPNKTTPISNNSNNNNINSNNSNNSNKNSSSNNKNDRRPSSPLVLINHSPDNNNKGIEKYNGVMPTHLNTNSSNSNNNTSSNSSSNHNTQAVGTLITPIKTADGVSLSRNVSDESARGSTHSDTLITEVDTRHRVSIVIQQTSVSENLNEDDNDSGDVMLTPIESTAM
eukprot:gene27577-34320_t